MTIVFRDGDINALFKDSGVPVVWKTNSYLGIYNRHDITVVDDRGKARITGSENILTVKTTDFSTASIDDPITADGVDYSIREIRFTGDQGTLDLVLGAIGLAPPQAPPNWKQYVDDGDAASLAAANNYTDDAISAETNARIAGDADAKAYSDQNLSDEVTARQVADADEAAQRNGQDLIILDALNLKADTTYVDSQDLILQAEIDAIEGADLSLKADITYVDDQDAALQTQIDAIEGADLSLKADITYVDSQDAAEASARASADSTETSARIAADALKADKTYVDSKDTAEVTARNAAIAAEATLRTNADALKADKTYVDSQDTAEVTARNAAIAAEATLRTNADALKADKTYVDSQDAAEVTARNAAIAVETSARIAADALKQNTLTGTGLARNTGASSELSGDVTTSGSNVATVVKINGATPAAIALSGAWSDLQAPTADLTLSAAAFNTEFDHTSAATWKWRNTTLATNATTNNTPSLNLSANYWTGAASAEDNWKISASLAAGTNGIPTLTIAHTGSTGTSIVSIPGNLSFFQTMTGRTDVNIVNSGNSQIALQGNSGFAAKSSDSLSVLDDNNTHGKFSTTLQNTTAATSGTSQSSETLYLEGRYWTGAASAADNWSLQNVIANGTNGTSTLTFLHSGSSGAASIVIPAGNAYTVAALQIAGAGQNWGLTKSSGGRIAICAGGAGILVFYASGQTHTSKDGGLVWSSTTDPEGTLDAGLTRISAGLIGVGNGAASDFSAGLKLTNLNNQGGTIVKRVAKSANYTTTATDYAIVFTATATLTLDSAAAVAGTLYRVKLSAAAAGGSVLTISPNNSKTIDGASTQSITTLGGSVDIIYDGSSNWEVF